MYETCEIFIKYITTKIPFFKKKIFKKDIQELIFHKILLKFTRFMTRDQVSETRGERPCSRES